MATNTQMEAQRLVSISLTKMAQSRSQRSGISLHKSLLVATVLQKARFLCMEEVFRMVHSGPIHLATSVRDEQCYDFEDDHLVGLTAEEAGITSNSNYPSEPNKDDRCGSGFECDKENQAPEPPTYFDLDKSAKEQQCFRDKLSPPRFISSSPYKRRRAVCEESEEAEDVFQSILAKKCRRTSSANTCNNSDCEDSVFDDDEESEVLVENAADNSNKSMDIDRITSLVSIFSFGGMTPSSSTVNLSDTPSSCSNTPTAYGNLSRASSTPDLCSAQAKETTALQQRPFLTMTV